MADDLKRDDLESLAIAYHSLPVPGKLAIQPTKRLANQQDLSLAYSPGVAYACRMIVDDPAGAAQVTARANLVAVVTNGSAVLGLGNIGPLAAKPVMEGKAVLFKKFAGIDVFDIELAESDPDRLVDIIAALEPTFGGINLEDIKAPECFIVERACRERMRIPVLHDDQHGTAICVAAAVRNGLRLLDRAIGDVRLACCGAGAAALACLDLLVSMGLDPGKVTVVDVDGVVHAGRTHNMDPFKARYARDTGRRTLADAVEGADVFLGLSAAGALKPEMVATMVERPLILALANPEPEILPELARAVRPQAIVCTGRSDYPNQVNNVLCFPFLFRGALDGGATTINEEMKLAAAEAIAELALAEASDIVASAYGDQQLGFGPDYIIPKPFDPRLILSVAPAVAAAAMRSGVAARPIEDMAAYRRSLAQHVYRTGFVMRPLFERARANPKRVAYAEGEEPRVLRAVKQALDEGLVRPILIGRRRLVEQRIAELGLALDLERDVELFDYAEDPRTADFARDFHWAMARDGITPDLAETLMRTRPTQVAAVMVMRGDADAMIAGTVGRQRLHLRAVVDLIGQRPGAREVAGLDLLVLDGQSVFICDTLVNEDPTAEQVADMTLLAAAHVRRFGLEPRVALLSHSNFGSAVSPSARKMRRARELVHQAAPDLEVEGEMQADTALSERVRERLFPGARLHGQANLLVMPTLDAANIAFNLARSLGNGISVGPMLIGIARPAHVVNPTVRVRGLLNMTAVAVVGAQADAEARGAA